jgi:hypothetical protein
MGMIQTAKSVTDKIRTSIDPNKMKKTAGQLSSFLQNSEAKIKDMKDEKGNPIGSQLMETLEAPLKMAQGGSINPATIAKMLGSMMGKK